ncbi:hypothetical protein ACH4VR_29675 [Streptomyces sp. NPDC020883]|uniref:hypothetical protein n=1 Tax=Streptomyces sp. NPDC020883 TaxID=3365099 RepID=UPI0037BCC658
MTTPPHDTIETAYAAGAPRIASLEVTEGEPDGTPITWNLGPIAAFARRPRAGESDLYEIWPKDLPTIIRIPAGTPVRFTLHPQAPSTPPPAPAPAPTVQPTRYPPAPPPQQPAPQQAPSPPWLT